MERSYNRRRKERERRRVKRVLEGNSLGGLMSSNKAPSIMLAVALLIILFFGGTLIGKILAGAAIIYAIYCIIKNN